MGFVAAKIARLACGRVGFPGLSAELKGYPQRSHVTLRAPPSGDPLSQPSAGSGLDWQKEQRAIPVLPKQKMCRRRKNAKAC